MICRRHYHYHGSGHVWQGRFKAFPIQQDEPLLTVLRYVERNPLRARMVHRAEEWAWSSLSGRPSGKRPELLSDGPAMMPRNWLSLVNKPQTADEVAALQKCISRGAPLGDERWTTRTAKRLGLDSTLKPQTPQIPKKVDFPLVTPPLSLPFPLFSTRMFFRLWMTIARKSTHSLWSWHYNQCWRLPAQTFGGQHSADGPHRDGGQLFHALSGPNGRIFRGFQGSAPPRLGGSLIGIQEFQNSRRQSLQLP